MTTSLHARVCVVHEKDASWKLVRARLELLVAEGFIRPLVVLTVGSGATLTVDPIVSVTSLGSDGSLLTQEVSLLGYLAALGTIPGVTLAAIRCDSSSSPANLEESADLNSAMDTLSATLVKFAVGLDRRDIRLAVIGEEERAPGSPFFTSMSAANVIVAPRDISMNRAVARPVIRENQETFVAHAATEISSALGLWVAMNSAPLDSISVSPLGIAGYRVHIFSSRVKGLLAPPLPIKDLVDDSGDLPLPTGFSPVDNLGVVVERYANVLYPSNMTFESLAKPDDHVFRSWKTLAKAYCTEFAKTVISIPSLLRRGFQGEIDAIGANALDRLVGGADARIRPMIPSDGADASALITENAIEEIIRDIEFREGRPVVGGVTTEQWEELITQVLGVADANVQSQPARETVMPTSILIRDKDFLAPQTATVSRLVQTIMPPDERILATDEDEQPDGSLIPEAGETSSDFVETLPPPVVERFVAPEEIDLQALREAVRRSGMDRPPAEPEVEPDVTIGDHAVHADRTTLTLIDHLTRRFDVEFRKAENSALESLTELRSLPQRFARINFGEISLVVVGAIALSLGLIFVSLATHSPLRNAFSFDWTSKRNRDFAWVAVSSLMVVIAVAALPGRNQRHWQARIMILAAICTGILGVEYVVFDTVRNLILDSNIDSYTILASIVILVAAAAIAVVSIRSNAQSSDPIRKRIARLLAVVFWLYLVAGACSYIAGSESFVNGWSDSTRHRFLIAIQFGGWLVLLTAMVVVVAVRVRQRNAFGAYQATFNWAQENLTFAIDARRHLRAAYTQWLMIAAMVSRIVWYPLGREASDRTAFEGMLAGDEAVLKFDLAQIELSDQGRIALLARLRQMFVRRGWLRTQFDHARAAYQAEIAFITGDPLEQHDPIGCPSVPPVEDLLADDARGDRFLFAKKLLGGEFDARLLGAATQNNLDTVYSNIMADSRMHTVLQSQNPFATGADFLDDIVPDEQTKVPPRVLKSLHVPSDEILKMTSHLWWPDTQLLPVPAANYAELHPSQLVTLDRLNDSVVMVSVLAEVSQGFVNSDVSILEDARLGDESVDG